MKDWRWIRKLRKCLRISLFQTPRIAPKVPPAHSKLKPRARNSSYSRQCNNNRKLRLSSTNTKYKLNLFLSRKLVPPLGPLVLVVIQDTGQQPRVNLQASRVHWKVKCLIILLVIFPLANYSHPFKPILKR